MTNKQLRLWANGTAWRRIWGIVLSGLLAACGGKEGEAGDVDTSDEASDDSEPDTVDTTTLAGKYAKHFSIGAAIDRDSYETHRDILVEHFNSVTCENAMKFESLQRTEGRFDYRLADRLVDFAVENGMQVRGHALVWHRQTPDWVFEDENDEPASEELLFERMKSHITNVMEHFKGKVYAWDVVNEAIMNDGAFRTGNEMREDHVSKWYGIAEERYIAEAFRYAREADPDAKLFYNDYYNYVPDRYEAVYELLKALKDEDLVDGVGLQGHFKLAPAEDKNDDNYYQTIEYMEKAIELYASLGLEIQITEMDVSLYLSGVNYSEDDFYDADTFTSELEETQAKRYADYLENTAMSLPM